MVTNAVANQLHNLPLYVTTETCSGATYIVTGANTGLGLSAATTLVSLGAARVILGVRNTSAGDAAKLRIESETGKVGVAEVWALDISSYDSVKAFAKRAVEELERIDAVIENAGVAASERSLAEGHVLNVTVNVLGTLLLGVLLLPKLSESAKRFGILPHIAIVTSETAFDVEAYWNEIKDDPLAKMDDEAMVTMRTYPLSKLLAILAVRHLATLLPLSRTGVVINTVNPGFCKTDLSRNAPPNFRKMILEQHEMYGRTPEDGARTLLHGAVAGKESHGSYLDACVIAENAVPSWVTDEEGKQSQKRVWESIARELEAAEPGCVKAIL